MNVATNSSIRSFDKMLLVAIFIPLAQSINFPQDFPPFPKVIAQASFAFEGKTYTLRIVPKKGAVLEKPRGGYCEKGDRCAKLSGDFDLILKSGPEELSKVTLRELSFDYNRREWHGSGIRPLKVLQRRGKMPLIYVSQYGASIANEYFFYWLETHNSKPVLRPVRFVNSPQKQGERNVLAAGRSKDSVWLVKMAAASLYTLWIEGYNNADPYVGAFLEQYVEDSPGVWRCVGDYTEWKGTYKRMKSRLLKESIRP